LTIKEQMKAFLSPHMAVKPSACNSVEVSQLFWQIILLQ